MTRIDPFSADVLKRSSGAPDPFAPLSPTEEEVSDAEQDDARERREGDTLLDPFGEFIAKRLRSGEVGEIGSIEEVRASGIRGLLRLVGGPGRALEATGAKSRRAGEGAIEVSEQQLGIERLDFDAPIRPDAPIEEQASLAAAAQEIADPTGAMAAFATPVDGEVSRKVMEQTGLNKAEAEAFIRLLEAGPVTEGPSLEVPEAETTLGKVGAGIGLGIGVLAETLGTKLETIGQGMRDIVDPALEDAGRGQSIASASKSVREGGFQPKNTKWWLANIPEVGVDIGVSIFVSGGVRSLLRKFGLGAPLSTKLGITAGASFSAASEAGNVHADIKEALIANGTMPDDAAAAADLVGMQVFAGNVILEQIPLFEILAKGPAQKVLGRLTKDSVFRHLNKPVGAAITEGITETLQSANEIIAGMGATGEIPEDAVDQLLASAALGSVVGGTLGAAFRGTDLTQEPSEPTQPEVPTEPIETEPNGTKRDGTEPEAQIERVEERRTQPVRLRGEDLVPVQKQPQEVKDQLLALAEEGDIRFVVQEETKLLETADGTTIDPSVLGLDPESLEAGQPVIIEQAIAQNVLTRDPEVEPIETLPTQTEKERNVAQRAGQVLIDIAEQRRKEQGVTLSAGFNTDQAFTELIWATGQVVKGAGNLASFTVDFVNTFGEDARSRAEAAFKKAQRVSQRMRSEETSINDILRSEVDGEDLQIGLDDEQTAAVTEAFGEAATATFDARRERNKLQGLRAAAQARTANAQAIQRQAKDILKVIPNRELRNQLVVQAERATTPARLEKLMDKIERALNLHEGRSALADTKKLSGRKNLLKLANTEESGKLRDQARKLISEAETLRNSLKLRAGKDQAPVGDEAVAIASQRAEEIRDELTEIFHNQKQESKLQAFGRLGTREQNVETLTSNIDELNKKLTDPKLRDDKNTNLLKRMNNALSDTRNIATGIEGKAGILNEMMWNTYTEQDEAMLSEKREITKKMTGILSDAGFRDVGDAMLKTSMAGGKGVTQTVTIELANGQEAELATGELMSLILSDPETKAKINEGRSIKLQRGLFKKPDKIKTGSMDIFVSQLDPKLVEAGMRIKREVIEPLGERIDEATRKLRGHGIEFVEEYWPTVTDRTTSLTRGLPGATAAVARTKFANAALENMGFTKLREEDATAPIVISDFVTVASNHVDKALKLIHLAELTRDMTSVVYDQRVQTAVTEAHGKQAYARLLRHIEHISLVNEGKHGDGWLAIPNRIAGHLMQNNAIDKLALNPPTWAKQLGSIPRMIAQLSPEEITAGAKSAKGQDIEEILDGSGFAWHRMASNQTARTSGVDVGSEAIEPGTDTTGINSFFGSVASSGKGFAVAAEEATQNFLNGDFWGGYRALRRAGMSSFDILTYFDALSFKFGWAAMKERADNEIPDATPEERTRFIAKNANDLVRDTNNSSRPVDMASIQLDFRGNVLNLFTQFMSDTLKARNRMVRSAKSGPKQFSKDAAAEIANMAWSIAVSKSWGIGVGLAVAASLGDEEDVERVIEESTRLDRIVWDIFSQSVGLIDPLISQRVIDMVRFGGGLEDTAALDSVNSFILNMKDVVDDVAELTDGVDEEEIFDLFTDVTQAANDFLSSIGVLPGGSAVRKTLREVEKTVD